MKKIITLLLMTFVLCVNAQDPSPLPSATIKKLIAPNTPVFYYNTADSTMQVFKGVYEWNKLFSARKVQHMIDSLSYEADAPIQEIPVTVQGMTTYTLPWKLRANSMVYYNGNLLNNAKWNGIGTIYVTVSCHVVLNDMIKIKR